MYRATVRSDGTYKIESLPVGNYVVLMVSEHVKVLGTVDFEKMITSIEFSSDELSNISFAASLRNYEVFEPVEIVANETKTIDCDFGKTWF